MRNCIFFKCWALPWRFLTQEGHHSLITDLWSSLEFTDFLVDNHRQHNFPNKHLSFHAYVTEFCEVFCHIQMPSLWWFRRHLMSWPCFSMCSNGYSFGPMFIITCPGTKYIGKYLQHSGRSHFPNTQPLNYFLETWMLAPIPMQVTPPCKQKMTQQAEEYISRDSACMPFLFFKALLKLWIPSRQLIPSQPPHDILPLAKAKEMLNRYTPWHFGLNQNHTTTPSVSCLTPLKFSHSPCSLKFDTWNTNRTSDTLVLCNMQPIAATFVAHSRQESSDAHQQSSNFSWIKAQKQYSTKIKTSSLSGQGDHLYTQKRITCTQGSLVHIEPHLYTYRNKNLRSLVHTQNHNHHTSTTHSNV